ncbi:hypothetical protein [Kitasatospora sp. GAS204B]|uniref:hypothetical protein n=1 Tax=unclassified Kitasatospora TaxID=2633591 RepID=UPI002474418C|nr:hypothetical protein [Kitasatospora sp. GAS204B]MDH6118559.1 hypothetical protein [Kitasatospora sp. GAS204B]
MHREELVRSWKDPRARQGGHGEHPSGEIALGGGGALGRRAALLSGAPAAPGLGHAGSVSTDTDTYTSP